MRLLNIYISRAFLQFFGLSLGGCVGLFFLVELFDRLDEFLERQVAWYGAGRYLVFKLPGIAYQVVPVACLLASVLTFSTLNKGSEIIAMRAAGVAPWRLASPVLLFGGLSGAALLLITTNGLVDLVTVDRDLFGRFDAQPDLVTSDLYDDDRNIIIDDNTFVFFPRQNQHNRFLRFTQPPIAGGS